MAQNEAQVCDCSHGHHHPQDSFLPDWYIGSQVPNLLNAGFAFQSPFSPPAARHPVFMISLLRLHGLLVILIVFI